MARLANEKYDVAASEDEEALPPLYLHGIVFWDEHHKKVRLGHAPQWECLLY